LREDPADSVVGTWRVERFSQRQARDSTRIFPFGLSPLGYLVYDNTGHVFFQVMSAGGMDTLRQLRSQDAPDSILRRFFRGTIAYSFWGTYRVDPGNRVVTHFLEAEFPPKGGSVEISTPYRFAADTLVLGVDSLQSWVLLRVKK
jgi:hypothetical protein